MCTKGSFPRDDWNHFPQMFSCSHVLSNRKQSVMPKRAQESTAKEGSAGGETGTDDFGVKELPERKENLSRKRVFRAARGIKSWIRVMFHGAPGNWCETTTKTQQHVLKSGDKMTIRFGAPGNWCGVVDLQVQGAPGNWCENMTIKSKGQGWNSTICKSPNIDTLKKSSRT